MVEADPLVTENSSELVHQEQHSSLGNISSEHILRDVVENLLNMDMFA